MATRKFDLCVTNKVLFYCILTTSLSAPRPIRHSFNSGDGLNNTPVSRDGCFRHNGVVNLKNTEIMFHVIQTPQAVMSRGYLQGAVLPFLMCVQWSGISLLPEEDLLNVFWKIAADGIGFKK